MSRNNINKNDILSNIKDHYRLPSSFIEKIYNDIFEIIIEGLKEKGRFKISRFGTFKVLFKRKRLGMNPKSKIKYPINERKVVTFSVSKILKNKLNG